MKRLVVAGVGNIFRGDDAFGVEVIRRLSVEPKTDGVDYIDFGIRSLDLTYALLDRYDAAVLIDTFQSTGAPGTLYVIEPELPASDIAAADASLCPHELDPTQVLRVIRAMQGRCRCVVLLGCEPADFGDELQGKMGLSDAVAAAVNPAVEWIRSTVDQWRTSYGGSLCTPGQYSELSLPA